MSEIQSEIQGKSTRNFDLRLETGVTSGSLKFASTNATKRSFGIRQDSSQISIEVKIDFWEFLIYLEIKFIAQYIFN
jgi:hypothetical protein